MNLNTNLRKKGFIVTEHENKGKEFRNKWIESFFEFKKIPNHNFLWELIHIRYMDLDLLEGKDATKAFDKVNKQYCYIFFQYSNDVLKVEFASEMKAKDLFSKEYGDYSDKYVVDKGFNWTFVIPHEVDYGPYFFRRRK